VSFAKFNRLFLKVAGMEFNLVDCRNDFCCFQQLFKIGLREIADSDCFDFALLIEMLQRLPGVCIYGCPVLKLCFVGGPMDQIKVQIVEP